MWCVRLVLALVSLIALVNLGACGSAAPTSRGGPYVGMSTGGVGDATTIAFADEAISGELVRADGGKSTGQKVGSSVKRPIDQRLVKNAWMTLEVDDEDAIEDAIVRLDATARRLDGYVASRREDGITLKVPTGRLDEALAVLHQLGEVTDEQIDVQDVTDRYVDLQIRIENLRKLRDRLTQLLEQGQNVKDVLEVEKELARVTGQLEQLEGQMRLISNQIAYATVNIRVEESVSPGPLGWVFYGAYTGVKWLFVWD